MDFLHAWPWRVRYAAYTFKSNLIPFVVLSSFQAERQVCASLNKGNVMAIFGPQDDYIAEHIKSITDMIEVPFIDTR